MDSVKKKEAAWGAGEIEKKLRASGINPTAQRLAICEFVLGEADHPTAEGVKQWADKHFPKMSLATVYNTLNLLVQAKLLIEVKLPHSDSIVYDCHTADHFHFIDEETGKVTDIQPDELRVEFKLKKEFQITGMDIFFRGTRR